MKKIMILGAGVYQVPLIEKSKSLGFYTIVVSIPGNYPGFNIADKVAYIDTTDYEKVYQIAKEENINAILTTGTDVALITIGYVCDRLSLTGITFDAAKKCTDKALMKKAFEQNGVSTAKYRTIFSYDDVQQACSDLHYPVMLKIVDKSGSRGITRINNDEMLFEAYEYCSKSTNSDHMIVEQYINAHEIGVDAFIQNGKIKIFVPHDKLVLKTKRTDIPKGHICPINVNDNVFNELYHQTELVIKALTLDNCAVNIDAFIDKQGKVYIIEASGRCGATGIPEVISSYFGIDYYKIMIENALGYSSEFNMMESKKYVASSLIFSPTTGILHKLEYNKNSICSSDYLNFDYSTGQKVRAAENGTDRIGMIIVNGQSYDDVISRINIFENGLLIETE